MYSSKFELVYCLFCKKGKSRDIKIALIVSLTLKLDYTNEYDSRF